MALHRYDARVVVRELALLFVVGLFCVPIYVLITLSLKSNIGVFAKPLAFPRHPALASYSEAWKHGGNLGLGHSMFVSVTITVTSVAFLVVIGSLTAYALARSIARVSNFLYVLFLVGIILPYQLAIIPLFIAMRHLQLTGNILGMVVLEVGLLTPLVVFLYTGFIRALPKDYEEAAEVDGAGFVRTWLFVVFPLLAPVTGTVMILSGLVIWNEFFLALIFLFGSNDETLPVALYSLVGANTTLWNVIMAGVVIVIAPMLLFYGFTQKYFIRGFAGGVKG
jgi:raffinose/stachyose/melibiose transport system permease protein